MNATIERHCHHRAAQVHESGSTLIGIAMVVLVLGVLAVIVVLAVQNHSGNARARSSPAAGAQSACAADLSATRTAVDLFQAQTGFYPSILPANWTSTSGTVALDYPRNGSSTATKYTSAMAQLQGTVTSPGPSSDTSGPWLKDTPQSDGHYSIVVSYDGNGTVTVLNPAGAPSSCSSIS